MKFIIAILSPIVWLVCRVLFRIEFRGVENIPPDGACIIVPNHITYADPIWITIPVRRRIYYMAWDKPFRIPVLGFLMRTFGAFPLNIDTIDKSAHRSAIDLLESSHALVVFPEGGRTRTGRLESFKLGAFRLALAHGVPVVPVTIRGASSIWPVGQMLPRPGKLTITYHAPIRVERLSNEASRSEMREQARKLANRARAVVASALPPENIPEEESEKLASMEA